MNVVVCDLNSIIPANVIAPFSQASSEARRLEERLRKEEEARIEAERKNKINQRILDSGIIAKINERLLDGVNVSFLIQQDGKNCCRDTNNWELARYATLIPEVKNDELLSWIKEKYTNAGYRIYNYEYSHYYYKDRELIIYAPTK
jgi:hypothetical protein